MKRKIHVERGCERKIDIFKQEKRQRWIPFKTRHVPHRRLKWFSVKSSSRAFGAWWWNHSSFFFRGCQGIEGVKRREIVEIVRKIDFDWSDDLWLKIPDSLFFAEEFFEKILLKVGWMLGFVRGDFYGILHVNTRCRRKEIKKKGQIQIPKTDWLLIKVFSPSCINPSLCRCLSLVSCLYQPNASKIERDSALNKHSRFLVAWEQEIFFSLDEWKPSVMDWKKMQARSLFKGQTAT